MLQEIKAGNRAWQMVIALSPGVPREMSESKATEKKKRKKRKKAGDRLGVFVLPRHVESVNVLAGLYIYI